MILQLEIFHKSGKGRFSYRFCPEKRPRDVSPRPLPPPPSRETLSSKMILWSWSQSVVSRANGPRPKHAPRIILANGEQGWT